MRKNVFGVYCLILSMVILILTVDTAIVSASPMITPTIIGTMGSNDWYTSNVTVNWIVTDTESGIASTFGCYPQTLTTETLGNTITCSATNNTGSSSSSSVTIKIDKTGPSASLVASGTSGSNDWYTSDVVVGTNGFDLMSFPTTCTPYQTVSSETSGTVVTGSCTNGAGLTTNAVPLTIKIDKTAPSASLSVKSGTLGTNGWYTSVVVINTTGSDTISSPVTCTPDQAEIADTTGVTVSGSCTNDAGLTTDATPMTLKIDTTAPTNVQLIPSGTWVSGGSGGSAWFTSDVTVNTIGDELISTPFTCTDTQHFTSDVNGLIVNGNCTNDAGLKADATSFTLNIDKTPPTTTDDTPTGWQNAPFIVTLTCSDGGSGCANTYYTLDGGSSGTGTPGNSISITTDGNHVITYYSVDVVGNREATKTTYAKLSTIPPSITVSATSGGINYISGMWTNKDVIVSFSCTDATYGIASCTGSQIISTEGKDQSVTGTATNTVGNTASVTFTGIDIDKSAPIIIITAPKDGTNYGLNQLVLANWQATDSGSGIASVIATVPNGTAIDTSTTGTKTFSINASDNAGNQAVETVTYNITSTSSTSKNGSISGMKFNDLNHDGIREANESGLANWTITLKDQTEGLITTKTNTTGNYIFTNLTDGNYTVGEVQQNGWNQTAPVTGTYNVTITGGAAITGKDFGNFQNVVKCDNEVDQKKLDDDTKKLNDDTRKLNDDTRKLNDDTRKLNDDTKKLHDDTIKKVSPTVLTLDKQKVNDDKKKTDDDKKNVDNDKKKLDDDNNKCKDGPVTTLLSPDST